MPLSIALIDLNRLFEPEKPMSHSVKTELLRGSLIDSRNLADLAGIGYVKLQCDLEFIRALNIPAVIRVRKEGKSGYTILSALNESSATLTLKNEKMRLSLAALKKIYDQEAHFLAGSTFVSDTALSEKSPAGLDIRMLQDMLKIRGYYGGNCNGWFTAETADAVKIFQRDHSLVPTGVVDVKTRLLIYARCVKGELPRPYVRTWKGRVTDIRPFQEEALR